jgi:hypothetical protein
MHCRWRRVSASISEAALTAEHFLYCFHDFLSRVGEKVHQVPGSFYEVISHDFHVDSGAQWNRPDLGFDAGNAQAIFTMTATAT